MAEVNRTARRWDWVWLLVAGLASSAYCISTAHRVGVTFDEPAYVQFGCQGWRDDSNWRLVTFGVMPLPPDVQTLPLNIWEYWTNSPPPEDDLSKSLPVARAANLVFWWVLLTHVMLLGRAFGGSWAGRIALLLVAADPTFLANASLATTDTAVAAMVLAFIHHTAAGRRRGLTRRVLIPGFLLGLTGLAKVSGLLYGAIALALLESWDLIASGRLARPPGATLGGWARHVSFVLLGVGVEAVTIGTIAVGLIGVYCGVDRNEDRPLVKIAEWLPPDDEMKESAIALAAKYPTVPNAAAIVYFQYWQNHRGRGIFLWGQWREEGCWYFFPALLLMKTPLPVLLLAVAVLLTRPTRAINLLTILALALLLPTLGSNLMNGVRLLLPIMALGYAGLAVALVRAWGRCGRNIGLGACAIVAGTSLWVWPHALCYLNQASGGRADAHTQVADSNYDWGQGIPDLLRWYEENGRPAQGIAVWYFGGDPLVSEPPLYLVRPDQLPIIHGQELKDVAGPYLLAVGTSVFAVHPEGSPAKTAALRWLKNHQPIARTPTFFIYDLRDQP